MLDALLKYVPKSLHPAYLGLLSQIPDHMTRIAVVGESGGAAGYLLKKRPGVQVTGAVLDRRLADVAAQMLDSVVNSPEDAAPLPSEGFDALLLCNVETARAEAVGWLDCLAAKLRPQGLVYLLFGAPDFALAGAETLPQLEAAVVSDLGARGFQVYLRWPLVEQERSEPRGLLLAAVSPAYNPVLHAEELRAAGHPVGAYHTLTQIPGAYLANPASRETIGLAKLGALADWIRLVQGHDVTNLLGRALDEFYRLSDEFPGHHEAYAAMASCWEAGGDPDMAGRLLRTTGYDTSSTLPSPRPSSRIAIQHSDASIPEWDGKRPFRVLYLIHPRPHYGLDVLFDGLCACLGDSQVVDYPWKPTLHGGETPEHRHYPCRFNRRGASMSLAEICAGLEQRAFDFILFGDVEGELPDADVAAILQARGACPVFLMDALDEMGNFRPRTLQRLGLASFSGYFKREMHGRMEYGPGTWPMPFAFSGEQGLMEPVGERPYDFFWAGHRRFGQRRLYLETLERRFGWNLNVHYDQAAYQARIRKSRMGLNCFGMGFDTVRYWELAAQGCMLLSDRLPILIPHNFEDGVHAVFFDDLGELVDKLEYYLHQPEESRRIAEAGRLHFQRYHTNRARAAQLLGRVEAVLAGNNS